jgi:L-asparaginase
VRGRYATGKALDQAGVIGGADLTAEAALTKLSFLLGQGLPIPEVKRQMQANLRGELTEDLEDPGFRRRRAHEPGC